MARHYEAHYNGKLVGTRSTATRAYTHAYVLQYNEKLERAEAYGYAGDAADRRNYDWYKSTVDRGVGQPRWPGDTYLKHVMIEEGDVVEARERIEGGFDGYVARERQKLIDRFEHKLRTGGFEPYVGGFAASERLAQKAALTWCRRWPSGGCAFLAVVPAVEVAKRARKGRAA